VSEAFRYFCETSEEAINSRACQKFSFPTTSENSGN
jgi:hypothetical protein